MHDRWSRRRLLLASAAAATVAGCTDATTDDGAGEASDADDDPAESADDARSADDDTAEVDADSTPDDGNSTDGDADSTDGDAAADLDLREANVTGVEVEQTDDERAYRVSVTLYHDDAGEEGYANWWQVETREGERLGRRDLLHAHGTEPFTRSETIEIPERVGCVVVRGHDQTHGYGGQAMLVSVPGGATTSHDRGSEPESFEDVACPETD